MTGILVGSLCWFGCLAYMGDWGWDGRVYKQREKRRCVQKQLKTAAKAAENGSLLTPTHIQ
jgi:hypothetical protein